MNRVHKHRIKVILASLIVIAVVIGLVTYALRQNISLFFTPTQLVTQKTKTHDNMIRVGGMVVKNSVKRSLNNLRVQFKITDFQESILVEYNGILPDLFREGQGIVATGYLQTNNR